MDTENTIENKFETFPVTPERWGDFEKLFGSNGACSGCWCMWWRMKRSDFAKTSGMEKRESILAIVNEGREPGILGYLDGKPVAWCSVAPRDEFPSLDRSNVLGRVDEKVVWSMVCFYFAVGFRRKGLMGKMIKAGVAFAKDRGAKIVEAYPIDPLRKISSSEVFTGLASAFVKAGFIEVARRSPSRPVMRSVI